MKAIHRAIFALLGELPPRYVHNPRIVALFGAKVTPLRAWACFIAFMVNGHLALARDLPAAGIKTLASFLGYAAGYLFVYLGLIGAGSVVVLSILGWFFSVFVQSALSASSETPFNLREAQQEKLEDWCINLILIGGEAYLILGYFLGFFWSRVPVSLW